jgi:SHS2 domain-containing protein
MKYEVFEHVSDVGLTIYGSTFKDLLENAGVALFEQIADLSTVAATDAVEVSAQGETIEDLFIDWLRELLYLFHGERYLLKEFEIIDLKKDSLKAVVKGERMDPGRHVMEGEVKGATYHNLEVKEMEGKWRAKVILDV